MILCGTPEVNHTHLIVFRDEKLFTRHSKIMLNNIHANFRASLLWGL